jgi:hypothetical protein
MALLPTRSDADACEPCMKPNLIIILSSWLGICMLLMLKAAGCRQMPGVLQYYYTAAEQFTKTAPTPGNPMHAC